MEGEWTRRRRRAVTLAVCFALLAASLVATLSQAAARRTGTNGIPAQLTFGTATAGDTICQSPERIPAGTGAIRLALLGGAASTPRLTLSLRNGEAARVASGRRARRESPSTVLVPLARPLPADVEGSVCIGLLAEDPPATYSLVGVEAVTADGMRNGGQRLPGRLHLEYVASGTRSWWSFAPTVARRIGLGHAWSGWSVAGLAALLSLTSIALGAWQLVRDSR